MAVDLYGATTDDVDRLLIWDVRESSDPPPAMIDDWLEEGALELHGKVGDLLVDDDCAGEAARLRARRIVVLYAASMAEDAHYPERTMDRRAGDHGARLWARYERLHGSLVTDIETCRDGIDTGGTVGGSGHTFPTPPMFAREMGS